MAHKAITPGMGDVIRVKQGKPGRVPFLVTVTGRSGSYPGWEVSMADGLRGIVLDSEIAEIIGA
jgi:hypothetical protein